MTKTIKVLLLGSDGMLGHDLGQVFENDNRYSLIQFTKKDLDITEEEDVHKSISEISPEFVINPAAYTAVDDCETNKEICMDVNGNAVGYLASACKKNDATLIHYSTDYVFRGDKKDGYPEDYDKIDPQCVYGKSKALGEKLLQQNTNKFYILRISWLYGSNGPNFVDTMIKLSNEKNKLDVVDDQHGNPTYSVDVANRTKYIIDQSLPLGIYHTVNENPTTWYHFAKKIFDLKNIKIELNPVTTNNFPRPAKRPKYSILLNTKIKPLMRSWEDALEDYLNSKK